MKTTNVILCPDWQQAEEALYLALKKVIRDLTLHPDRAQMTLLVDASSFPVSDRSDEASVSQILYDVVLDLLLTESIDVANAGLEIAIVEDLSQTEQAALAQQISCRIALPQTDWQATAPSFAELPLWNWQPA